MRSARPSGARSRPARPRASTCASSSTRQDPLFGVYREANVFDAGAPSGGAALVLRYIPNLPDAVRNQIDALSAIGINVATTGYEITAVSGVGDSAVWVKTSWCPVSLMTACLCS